MSWWSIIKNQIASTKGKTFQLDFNQPMIEDDDDCVQWVMELCKKMNAIFEPVKSRIEGYYPEKINTSIDNELACAIKKYYETSEYPDLNMADVPDEFRKVFHPLMYFTDVFSFALVIGKVKPIIEGTIVAGQEYIDWEDILEMNFDKSGYDDGDAVKNYFKIVAVSKGKDEDVMGIFNRTKTAIQHLNRPDLLKYFVEEFKAAVRVMVRHYAYYEKINKDILIKEIDEAYS
tara:strand:+ start:2042 stop:2737 length:696 start_codon:yes stop_codon:yes gene_type:complete